MTLLMLLGVLAVITLPSILWLYAIADVVINAFNTLTLKVIWIAILCVFPPIGTLLYFLIGRSQRRTRYPVGRFVLICILLIPIIMTIAYYLHSPVQVEQEREVPSSKSIQI